MDLELLQKGLDYAKKKRKWVFILGISSYGAYKVYNLPCVVEKRHKLSRLFSALISVAEMVSDSADAIGILSKDMKQFLGSDSDQIPQSLKQLSKIAHSEEFSGTLTRITRASTAGIITAYHHESTGGGGPGFSDKVMDKLFSDAGGGFASAVVGSFARNMVTALLSEWQKGGASSKNDGSLPWWVEVACEDKCRELVGEFIGQFVSTAIAVYLEKTMDVNTYEEFFVGLTNPKHEARVRDMIACVCNNAVETCVKTSYHVWRTNSSASKQYSGYSDGFGGDEKGGVRGKPVVRRGAERNRESGWMRTMGSTLAVPGNRKFVLDVTGVVTFESVRSFLEVMMEKVSEGIKTSVDVVQQEVVEKGVEAVRYASVRSSAVTALCLTLCFNILNSPWILTPYS